VGVRFQEADAAILFCVPTAGCDLNWLVERCTSFMRIAVPGYDFVAGCLDRCVRAGVMPAPVGGMYRLTPEWYARVHRLDDEFAASELAAIEFGEELVAQEWPEVGPEFVLPAAEFEQAAEHTRRSLDRLFAPYR
jgi:hypothetical protein